MRARRGGAHLPRAGRPERRGRGDALQVEGPVTIVDSDLPCATPNELPELVASAPALVPAPDGTTNAVALVDARDFRPLYGPGSADRFGLKQLDLPGLQEDVDTREDLLRLVPHAGPNTRTALLGQRG